VLARLLELNRKRAEQERLTGAAAEGKAKTRSLKRTSRKKANDQPENVPVAWVERLFMR